MSAISCKGFTVIELLIVLAILGILGALLLPVLSGHPEALTTRCIGGYKHTVGTYYEGPRQIIDENGKAIPCGSGG